MAGNLTTIGIGANSSSACAQPLPSPADTAQVDADSAITGPGACAALLRRYYLPMVADANATLTALLSMIGDGKCQGGLLNTAACSFDGGDW